MSEKLEIQTRVLSDTVLVLGELIASLGWYGASQIVSKSPILYCCHSTQQDA